GEAVVDVEQDAGVDRVLDCLIADAGGAERGKVGGAHVGGDEGEFLEEAERRPQLRIERRRAPIRQYRRHQPVVLLFVSQGHRRSAASASSRRPNGAPSAAETVISKRASSEVAARCSAPRSSSVTR